MKNFKKISMIVLVIIIILVFLLTIILPPSYYFITIDDGTWDDDERGKPSSYTQNVQMPASSNESEGLTVDKNAIIKEGLTNLNYTEEEIENLTDEEIIEKLGINKKLKKFPKVTSLDELTQAEILWCLNDVYSKYLDTPEELEKLLNAEIITQYPKIGSEDSELDGIIEFERHRTDETSTILTYIDYETFNGYINSYDEDVLDYFTIDEQGNVLIAISNTITEELTSNDGNIDISEYTQNLDESNIQEDGSYKKINTTIVSQIINYKNYVQKYTMSFQYLWALLVIGEDKDFVLELADLVENSEITISIYDNITNNKEVNTYKYKKETRTDKYVKISVEDDYDVTGYATERYWLSSDSPYPDIRYYDSRYQAKVTTDETEYEVKYTITIENDIPIVDLTRANVWIVDYSKEYKYQNGVTRTTENNSIELENTEYVLKNSKDSITDSNLLNDVDAVSFANSIKEYIESNFNESTNSSTNNSNSSSETTVEANVTVSYVKLKEYEHKKDRTLDQTLTSTVQEYVAQTPVNNPKVEKDSEEDNFVTILCKKKHKKAKNFLTSNEYASWLFEILEKNTDTQNMVELTRYLLNKVTDSDRFGEIEDTLLDSLFGGSYNFEGTSIVNGDINVSDESKFITDVETLKKAFLGYSNSAKLVEHAQDFLDMQKKYKVNALFAAAVSISETGAGNAGNAIKITTSQNSVGANIGVSWNNWFNIKASSTPYGILHNGEGESHYKIYSTVSDSIDNFGNNIANGSYYYKQGKYTVDEIGHTYCPNSEAYPTQGDDWVEHTLTYMNNFYSAVGITLGPSKDASSSEKLNYLFPDGVPTTQNECLSYITTVEVALTNKDGTKKTGTISVHKSLASDVQKVFQKAQDGGFKIYEAYGYCYRQMNNGGSGKLSHHSYGVAIDINVNENYSHKGSTIYAGSFWDPSKSEFSIPRDGVLVKAFESIGWKWGGNWSGNYQDYMHFSYTGN